MFSRMILTAFSHAVKCPFAETRHVSLTPTVHFSVKYTTMVVPSRKPGNVVIFLKEYLTENRTVGDRPMTHFIDAAPGAENPSYAIVWWDLS